MTGPEHYCEAEQALRLAAAAEFDSPQERYQVAIAHVHATLALAAAAALGAGQASSPGMLSRDAKAWQAVAGEPREVPAGVR